MYLEKPTHNHLYGGQNPDLYITEFGHTKLSAEKKIGPRVRSTYILHVIISGKCEFCGSVLSRGQAFLTVPGVRHDFSVSADLSIFGYHLPETSARRRFRFFHFRWQSCPFLLFQTLNTQRKC